MFIGPTDGRARARLAAHHDVTVAPPAARGDVAAAVARGFRRIVLVDGVFHQRLSVGHRELRDALAAGIGVVGMSSIGAVRAVEMAPFGMTGFGAVFDAFYADPELPDDEVAVLHAPTEPYRPVSEPLFHLRSWLGALDRDGMVSAEQHDDVVAALRRLWFGDRTLPYALAEVARRVGRAIGDVQCWARDFERHRWKVRDWNTFSAAELPPGEAGSTQRESGQASTG